MNAYVCSQEPHPGPEFYGIGGGCAECGWSPSEVEEDAEEFCPLCYAGTESSEHYEKCATWREEWQDQGFPWCDTCGAAAVFSESFGNLHTSRQYPHGVPKAADQSGHAVTMRQWSEAGIAKRASW